MSDAPETPTPPPSNVIRLVSKRDRVLSEAHREHLRTSGLSDESIDEGGFWTERDRNTIATMLNWRGWPKQLGDALVLPFYAPGQTEPFLLRVRPDSPTPNDKGKVRKYASPTGAVSGIYFPWRTRTRGWLSDPTRELVLVEGEKKAACLDQLGYAAIGSPGVDNFHDGPHRDDTDEIRFNPLITKHVVLARRRCLIAFDSDSVDNDNVVRAARRLAWMLKQAGAAEVVLVRIPHGPENAKQGIDDFFVRAGEEETRKLLATSLEPIEPLSGEDSRSLVKNYRTLAGIPLENRLRMPRGYNLTKTGSLISEDGEKIETVERAPIFVRRLVTDLYSGQEQAELVFKRNKAWRTVVVPRQTIADGRAAVRELSPIGAPIDSNTCSKVVKWLRDFEAENEKRLPRATSVARCGWHRVGTDDVFVLADPIMKEGAKVELVFDKHQERGRLTRALHVAGSYDEHLAAVRRAWDASPVAAAMIAAALAAPLLRPLGAPLFAVHLAGDSSRGKSTMLKVAASLYGNPRDDEWVTSWNATTVGHEVRAAALCDLPLPIDEAGVTDPRERERAVYMLVNGVGRTRGAKEGGLRETHSWRTVVLSTGERLLAEESAATGAQVRVLQLSVDGFGALDAAGVDAIGRATAENFGHLGKGWIEGLLECTAEDWDAHRASLKATSRTFQALATVHGASTLRARQAAFWALLAYVEAVAAETLGLGRPNGATMREFFERPGDSQLEVRSASERAIDLVREWISSKPACFPKLVISQSGAKAVQGEKTGREVLGYVDYMDERLFVLPTALRSMLDEHRISDLVVLREWRSKGWLQVGENHDTRFTIQIRAGGKRPRVVSLRGDLIGIAADGDSTATDAESF